MPTLGLLILRLVLATVFIVHGSHTLFGFFGGAGAGPGGLEPTSALYSAMGLEPAFLLAVTAGVVQFVGGVLLVIGLFTRWAALALLIDVVIGALFAHLQWGFFINWIGDPSRGHGIEYSLVLAGVLLCLIAAGAGDASIDGRRNRLAEAEAAGRARVRSRF